MDLKGRVSLPAHFRGLVGEEPLVLVCSYEHTLWLYKKSDFDAFIARFGDTTFNKSKRRLHDWFTSGAFNVEIDTAGRIRVPAHMQKYAGLDKNITITGNQDHAVLRSTSAFQSYLEEIDIDSLTDELVAEGILES